MFGGGGVVHMGKWIPTTFIVTIYEINFILNWDLIQLCKAPYIQKITPLDHFVNYLNSIFTNEINLSQKPLWDEKLIN